MTLNINVFVVYTILFYGCLHVYADELITNGNFENEDDVTPWFCQGNCSLQLSTDSHRGNLSVYVSNRHRNWDGLAQTVAVTGGARYKLSAYIKLLDLQNGSMYHNVDTNMMCVNASGRTNYVSFGHSPYVQTATGWNQVGGIAQVPSGMQFCHIYIQVNGTSTPWFPPGLGLDKYVGNTTTHSTVSYLVDDVSLKEIPIDQTWRQRANLRIDKLRKSDLTVRIVSNLTNAPPRGLLDVQLIQTSHEFPFGSAVQAEAIINSNYSKYQNVFFENFNWAVLENALKWRQIESTRGHLDYQTPLSAISKLRFKQIPIRGHTVFWGPWYMQQPWKNNLSKSGLVLAMRDHLYRVIEKTKGLLDHWDVNNENLHGDWYEQRTENPNVTMDMFHDVSALDPKPKLFLNDFGILGRCDRAMALRNQGLLYKRSNVPIYGIGIQSHLLYEELDMTMIRARLDLVAESGLPIWITELTVFEANNTKKAQAVEDLLTLYFSHPAVEGVLLWGFWDQKMFKGKNWSLFDGPAVTPNEAGLAYMKLYHTTWRTNETHTVHGQQRLHLRAFKGNYTIHAIQNGQIINSENFTLDHSGQTIEIHLNGSGKSYPDDFIYISGIDISLGTRKLGPDIHEVIKLLYSTQQIMKFYTQTN